MLSPFALYHQVMEKPFIVQYARGANVQLSEHFCLYEFECACGKCKETSINPFHVERLEALREQVEQPITITSGYRCHAYNRKVGGARKSQHMAGTATDIVISDMDPDQVANLCEHFTGLGRYDTFTHIDSRQGRKCRWDQRS